MRRALFAAPVTFFMFIATFFFFFFFFLGFGAGHDNPHLFLYFSSISFHLPFSISLFLFLRLLSFSVFTFSISFCLSLSFALALFLFSFSFAVTLPNAFRHIICHSIVLENKPYTKDLKLKSKSQLDRFPMFLKAEQINILMLSHDDTADELDLESETLITVMKDIRYHKLHAGHHKFFHLRSDNSLLDAEVGTTKSPKRHRSTSAKNYDAMAAVGLLAHAKIIDDSAADPNSKDGLFALAIGDAGSGSDVVDEVNMGFDLLLNRQHDALQFNTSEYVLSGYSARQPNLLMPEASLQHAPSYDLGMKWHCLPACAIFE